VKNEKRNCKGCALCCKYLEIPDFKKMWEWCYLCDIEQYRCKSYEMRNQDCIDFRCSWLFGNLPEFMAPMKTRLLVIGQDRAIKVICDHGIFHRITERAFASILDLARRMNADDIIFRGINSEFKIGKLYNYPNCTRGDYERIRYQLEKM
jgi:hypothetical protein